MDQDNTNNQSKSHRFFFSDEFYDELERLPEEKPVSFDAPKIPPISPMKQEKNKPSSAINNTVEKPIVNLIPDPVEEKIEIPSFKPTNQIQAMDTNVVEPKKEELSFVAPIEERKNNEDLVETSSQNSSIKENNFNVETGIDTTLEQEILKSKIENEMKNSAVENISFYKQPTTEKMVYRARHNATITPPIWLQEELEKEKIENLQSTNIMNDTNQIEEIQPKVINIDEELKKEEQHQKEMIDAQIVENYEENLSNLPVTKSDLLEKLKEKEKQTGKISILARYGDDFCSKDYITNPAIGRKEEIKQLILILLTPEKSAILVGKPGIGKTSIVEGLAYQLQRNNVPNVLKGYRIVSIKTTSLLGTLSTGETRLQTLIDEIKELDKIILFIDEIHMLMGATNESSLDFANMFKESLGRGSIKMIGATTSDEYERYVLRDKAFVRRFQRVDVEEPTRDQTIKILMGTLPKIEKNTGAKLKYSNYIQSEIMAFIVDITTEYKRVYGIGSRYPDICLTLLAQAFSQAVFDNRKEVDIQDIRNAIKNSKNIYPDVIRKELVNFDEKFSKLIQEN